MDDKFKGTHTSLVTPAYLGDDYLIMIKVVMMIVLTQAPSLPFTSNTPRSSTLHLPYILGGFSAKDKGNVFCIHRIRAPYTAIMFDALSFPVISSHSLSSHVL